MCTRIALIPTVILFDITSSGYQTLFLQVAHCYQDELSGFAVEIHKLLKTHASTLDAELRMTLCRALILLQRKNMFPIVTLLELFFRMFRVNDKLLRKSLYTHIITDIKRLNTKRINNQLNSVRIAYDYVHITYHPYLQW